MIGPLSAAVLANYIWEISPHLFRYSSGVSGFDVAVGGIILVFSVVNLVSLLKPSSLLETPQLRPTDKRALRAFLLVVYTVLMALMIAVPVTLVLAADPTINTQVHVDSFLLGIGMATIFQGIVMLRRLQRLGNRGVPKPGST
ncbi:MAG: hypothetical protein JRM77_09245 [Nitrososphaerota archaeon]|nr:hypothetical protein [Nitrososphaerota archaeon]